MSKKTRAQKRTGQNMQVKSLRARQRRVAQEMVDDVGRVANAFEAERWASWVHGQMWQQRHRAPQTRHLDWALVLGAQVAEDIAELACPEAKACLYALSWADQGPFGALCERLMTDLHPIEMPPWAHQIGEVLLVRAAADQRPGDATVFLFDVRRSGFEPHTLCAYVDHIHDGIAKHLHLMLPFDEMPVEGGEQTKPEDAQVWFVPVPLHWACHEVKAAVALTDAADDPAIGEIYAENRAMTLARLAPYLLESVESERLAA